jgi:hypothetical protein
MIPGKALTLWLLVGMTGMLAGLHESLLGTKRHGADNPVRDYVLRGPPVVAFLGLCFTGLLVSLSGPVQILIIASERWIESGNNVNCNDKVESKEEPTNNHGAST